MSNRQNLTLVESHGNSATQPTPGKPYSGRTAGATEIRPPDPEVAQAQYAHARQLQAQAMRELLARIARAVARGAGRLAAIAVSFQEAFGQALAARRTYEELSRLSDWQLADIGLVRGDIPDVVYGRLRRGNPPQTSPGATSDQRVEPEVRKAA